MPLYGNNMNNKMNKIKLPFNKRTLNHYELILTENCNFRCKYCFDDSFSDRTSCGYDYVMSPDMIPDIVNFIEKTKDKNCRPSITFFGGEPTLNWDFIEKFIEYCKQNNYDYSYNMNTNGSTLTPKKIDFLVDNRFSLVVSLDGIKESHDSSRVYKGNKGTWDSIMKILPNAIGKFRSHNLPITSMMVVNKDTYKYLSKNYEFLISLGFKDVNILWCWEEKFTDEELDDILASLKDTFIVKRLPLWLDARRTLLSDRYNYQNSSYCQTPQTSVTINCKGNIYFCHRLVPKMSSLEFNDNFGDIYNGYTNTEYLKFMSCRMQGKHKEVSKICSKCECYSFCKSGCIGSIRGNTGGYGIMDSLCKVQNMLLQFKKTWESR